MTREVVERDDLVTEVDVLEREVVGVRINEDTFSIQVRDVAGDVHSFWKSELATLEKHWGETPMPTYEGALSGDELDDLVAYLVSLRGEQR